MLSVGKSTLADRRSMFSSCVIPAFSTLAGMSYRCGKPVGGGLAEVDAVDAFAIDRHGRRSHRIHPVTNKVNRIILFIQA